MTLQGRVHNGVIVFEGAPELPEGMPVTVWIDNSKPQPPKGDDRLTEEEHQRILAAMDRIAALPNENPGDTFSGKDHDQALYGADALP